MLNLLKVFEKLLQNLIGLSFLNSQSNVNVSFDFFKNSKKFCNSFTVAICTVFDT